MCGNMEKDCAHHPLRDIVRSQSRMSLGGVVRFWLADFWSISLEVITHPWALLGPFIQVGFLHLFSFCTTRCPCFPSQSMALSGTCESYETCDWASTVAPSMSETCEMPSNCKGNCSFGPSLKGCLGICFSQRFLMTCSPSLAIHFLYSSSNMTGELCVVDMVSLYRFSYINHIWFSYTNHINMASLVLAFKTPGGPWATLGHRPRRPSHGSRARDAFGNGEVMLGATGSEGLGRNWWEESFSTVVEGDQPKARCNAGSFTRWTWRL